MYRQHRADRLFKRCQDCGKTLRLVKVILPYWKWHYRRFAIKYLCQECRIRELENVKSMRMNNTSNGR